MRIANCQLPGLYELSRCADDQRMRLRSPLNELYLLVDLLKRPGGLPDEVAQVAARSSVVIDVLHLEVNEWCTF